MKRSLFNLSILFLIMSFLIVGCTKDNSTGKSVNDGKNDSTETIGEKETLILAQSTVLYG